MPFYLRPSASTAPDALICGDPARALTIAQHVMGQPRMSNHNRGLWGYYGETPAGDPLTVQATGIGGPSAVAVLAESIERGVGRLIRIGTCAAIGAGAELGAARVIDAATADDGASRTLGADPGEILFPDDELTAALIAATGVPAANIRSGDVIAGGAEATGDEEAGLRDLQTAAVLSLCRRRRVAAAVAVVVRSLDGRPLHDDPLDAALLRLADAAVAALRATSTSS
jgi:uridine phosphorylase